MSVSAYLSLGSNVGDRAARLDAALARLAAAPGIAIHAVSSRHETEPVGGPAGQGAFLNAAAAVDTSLSPIQLLQALHAIESAEGRIRSGRWDQRTLDLDLILFGDDVIDTPILRVPHPRFAVRRFVLAPLAEIAPEAVDPLTGRTVGQLLSNLDRRPSFVCLVGPYCASLFGRVASGLNAIGLFEETGTDRSYQVVADLLNDPDWFALLEEKAREYEAERWSPEVWGDRWLVSDFWLGLLDRDARYRLRGDLREPSWNGRIREANGRAVQPTFLVATHPCSYWQLRRWAEKNPGDTTGGRQVPILGIGPDDPMGEGKRLYEQREGGFETPTHPEMERLVDEILSACAGTRP